MDSIEKTTVFSFLNYFKLLCKKGSIPFKKRYSLLLLWFLNYLRNDSNFIYKYSKNTGWAVDFDIVKEIENKFKANITCLTTNDCGNQYIQGNCFILDPPIQFPIPQEDDANVIILNDMNETCFIVSNNYENDNTFIGY